MACSPSPLQAFHFVLPHSSGFRFSPLAPTGLRFTHQHPFNPSVRYPMPLPAFTLLPQAPPGFTLFRLPPLNVCSLSPPSSISFSPAHATPFSICVTPLHSSKIQLAPLIAPSSNIRLTPSCSSFQQAFRSTRPFPAFALLIHAPFGFPSLHLNFGYGQEGTRSRMREGKTSRQRDDTGNSLRQPWKNGGEIPEDKRIASMAADGDTRFYVDTIILGKNFAIKVAKKSRGGRSYIRIPAEGLHSTVETVTTLTQDATMGKMGSILLGRLQVGLYEEPAMVSRCHTKGRRNSWSCPGDRKRCTNRSMVKARVKVRINNGWPKLSKISISLGERNCVVQIAIMAPNKKKKTRSQNNKSLPRKNRRLRRVWRRKESNGTGDGEGKQDTAGVDLKEVRKR